MLDNWNVVKLSDVIQIKYGKDHKKLAEGNIPVYGTGGIMRYVDRPLYDKKSVLIPRKGSLGNLYFVDKPFWTVDTLFYTEIDESQILPEYLYYKLKTYDLASLNVGSAVPSLTTAVLYPLTIELPPVETQMEIVSQLSVIDKKIKLNKKINQNLEEMVQSLFKSWFIDLEPFGGKVPENWSFGKLNDILQSVKSTVKASEIPELPYVPIDAIPKNSIGLESFKLSEEAKSSLMMFETNDILIGAMRVYFHRVSLAPFKGITRSTCFVLRPNSPEFLEFALLMCNLDSTINFANSTSKGSTMPYAVWENGLADLPILIPPKEILIEFQKIVGPMIKHIRDGIFESQHLQELRDNLLSELMTGKIRIP